VNPKNIKNTRNRDNKEGEALVNGYSALSLSVLAICWNTYDINF